MLTPEDRHAIDGLFDKLAEVERRGPQRDADAERLIEEKIGRQPAAPYYLAQTVVVQQQALEMAEQRIEDLERQAAQNRRGGLFGGLFNDAAEDARGAGRRRYRDDRGPWDRPQQPGYGGYGGGGFLAGAAQTALGVAGGVMLGSAIASMFGAGSAHAAEQPVDNQSSADDNGGDAGNDGADDGGGFDDAGGDFDIGGDF